MTRALHSVRLVGFVAALATATALLFVSATGEIRAEGDRIVTEGVDLASTVDGEVNRQIRRLVDDGFAGEGLAEITIDYPQDGSVFPPEIAAPTILWHDDHPEVDRWLAVVVLPGEGSRILAGVEGAPPPAGEIDPRCVSKANAPYEPTPYQASARSWKPGAQLWEAIKRETVDSPATLTLFGIRDGESASVVSRGSARLQTSSDLVGAPIFYRDVPLMPSATKEGVIKPLADSAVPLINWRLKDIGRDDSRVMLQDMPTCANCHSFSLDGKTLGMDVDGPQGDKGAYAVAPVERQLVIDDEQVITWNAFKDKPPGHHTLGFLSRISPDGRHVVSTVNEAIYVQNFRDYRFSQVFFPTRGILAVYSAETGDINALPGADDPSWVHCDGVWTPDGQTLVFARAAAKEPYDRTRPQARFAGDPNETQIQYDLFRIPFNDGRGGAPEPIVGASANGMSNTFPKVSPDGKWIVFVRCANGQLMRPDSKLWIVPVAGGEAREMRCNLPVMNSWHGFSPNGRWLVFSSKSNTPYTQMFLTHIDEEGNDTPPILIENATAANRAVNLPEFVNVAYDEFEGIAVPAVDHYPHFRRGNQLAQEGKLAEAIVEFEAALAGGPRDWRINDWRIHESYSKVLLQLGRRQEALEHIRTSLRLNPYNAEMHGNLGLLLYWHGDLDQALQHMDAAIQLQPRQAQTWFNRATIRLTFGDTAGALTDYDEVIRLEPGYADAYGSRGMLRRSLGDLAGALADYDQAVLLSPRDPMAWYGRALAREQSGDVNGAVSDSSRALEIAPAGWKLRGEVEGVRRRLEARTAGG